MKKVKNYATGFLARRVAADVSFYQFRWWGTS